MATPKDILNAMICYCQLGKDCEALNNHDFEERIVDPLADRGYEFDFDCGASKGVLIFDKEHFVIKVPFQACTYDESAYTDDLEAHDRGSLSYTPVIGDYLNYFERANNFFLETFSNWDYCELECAVYQEAKKEGLEPYFAKEQLLGYVNMHPVYVQEYVVPYAEASSTRPKEVTREKRTKTEDFCASFDQDCFNLRWIVDFIEVYGHDEFRRLCLFLKKLSIVDLHRGNVGYLNGFPILLDYSNFND